MREIPALPAAHLVLVRVFGHHHRVAAGHQQEEVAHPGGVRCEEQLPGPVHHRQLNVHVTELVLQPPVQHERRLLKLWEAGEAGREESESIVMWMSSSWSYWFSTNDGFSNCGRRVRDERDESQSQKSSVLSRLELLV